MRALAGAIERHEADLLEALHADLHKSPIDGYATEVGLVQSEIRHATRRVPKWAKPVRRPTPLFVWPAKGFVQPEPYGVALIMGPWNYPFQLIVGPLVSAIAAGNCAILKPSEFAPHTAEATARIIESAFPREQVAVVQGGRETAEALLSHRFDTIFFTGGTSVGRQVAAAAARHLTPVTLELGGKSPCIVCADAPIKLTARRIAWGKFMNAGQTCVAPDFLLVDEKIRDELTDAIGQSIREFYGEDPRTSPSYGRIIHRRHFDRLAALLDAGRIVYGGDRDADSRFLAPTLVADVPNDANMMREEIFGPILPVITYTTIEEAIEFLRPRPTPLALYLFTRDSAIQRRVLERTRSGGVCLNDTISHMLGHGLPFGGLGESGTGACHGRAGFDSFSHRRSVLRRSLAVDPPFRYPPARVGLATLKRAYRWMMGS